MSEYSKTSSGASHRFIFAVVVTFAVIVILSTWFVIKESRSDSLKLLTSQGTAFTEALAQAAENAIISESFYELLLQKRFNELTVEIVTIDYKSDEQELVRFALNHNLFSVSIFDKNSDLITAGIAGGIRSQLPEFVYGEVEELFENQETNYFLLLEQGDTPGDAVHYYLELTNDLEHVIALAIDAQYYISALSETQIGFLIQNMSREKGVEYILYQTNEGIIFASEKPGDILAIESDPFLQQALKQDTISNRIFEFQEKNVLELVRPFTIDNYPIGLFRVGLSLDGYYSVSRGFDFQMITVSVILFGLLLVVVLYLSGRVKRKELSRQYKQIKSITDKIFEEMRTGVAVIDNSGTITLCNNSFDRIIGKKDCIGNKWSKLIPPNDKLLSNIIELSSVEGDSETTNIFGGEQKTLLVSASQLSSDSKDNSTIVVIYNITRMKNFEKEAARKERLSEMGDLAAGVAHEIRNPLNTISIAAQRLAGEFKPQENSEEFVSFTKQIRSETMRLNEIITKFLALAKDRQVKFEKIDLSKLMEEFVSFILPEAEKLQIDIIANIGTDLSVEMNPDDLQKVLSNLFNNAKEAFDNQPEKKISISAFGKDDKVMIKFEDNGPGIPKENYDKVFTPYFTTKEAGTGLGLPTVYKIISELGGEVKVTESQLGGAGVEITLSR